MYYCIFKQDHCLVFDEMYKNFCIPFYLLIEYCDIMVDFLDDPCEVQCDINDAKKGQEVVEIFTTNGMWHSQALNNVFLEGKIGILTNILQ